MEDGEVPFSAQAHFSAPGWTPKDIKSYLIDTETADEADIKENSFSASVPFEGIFGASFGANTQFFVGEFNPMVQESGLCQLLYNRIKQTRGQMNMRDVHAFMQNFNSN